MSICRFEDRLSGQARVLKGLRTRITARTAKELPEAFAQIEAARRTGAWIALLIEYEVGEWLEPAIGQYSRKKTVHNASENKHPGLTALVFEQMTLETPWGMGDADTASVLTVQPEIEHKDYIARMTQIHEWIAQGEVYQINATFPMQVSTVGSAAALYRKIANHHPVAFAALIEDTDRTILSFSPELFLQRTGQTLVTRPMKGTAPRSADPATDQQTGLALQNSIKNRAENLMIVDLLRNDLGRVAVPGSVVAEPLFSLEKYPSVWTMTSTVQATIQKETSFETILSALFPCGSVTGAPKVAAMQRIRQTEPQPRGLYCGSIGWMAPSGDFCLNVAIRTLVMDHAGHGTYHVGGGIVYDSEPEQEWQECQWKARVLTQELPALIETMRADALGTIPLIELHLDRLEASARALNYAWPGREAVRHLVEDQLCATSAQGNQRIRLLLTAPGSVTVETAALPELTGQPSIAIAPVVLDHTQTLLQHKTTYRPWYSATTTWLAKHPGFFDLIFFNARDEVCEGSRSNIYIKKNGEWVTPECASGLLGGVQRRQLLDTRQARQGTLTRNDLLQPHAEIRLSNGLRGWFDVKLAWPSFLPGDFLP